jgi:7-cyano-7-deazaguanine synthase
MRMLHVFSGGLDSTVLLYDLLSAGNEVVCVNFEYGSKHNEQERERAVLTCRLTHVTMYALTLPLTKFRSSLLKYGGDVPNGHYQSSNMKSTVVPFRNGIMLSTAAGLAESLDCEAISYAAHGGDHAIYPDCRPGFVNSITEAIAKGTYKRIKLTAPYLHYTKPVIVLRGHVLDVPFKNTWSCYNGRMVHCGKCGACTERKEAFILAKVADPTIYETEEA